jgi:phytanoyl-CoA hydroxylase
MGAEGKYFSRFGGLWIDKVDQARVGEEIAAIENLELRTAISNFNRDGYVILRGAVEHDVIDRYLREYEIGTCTPGLLLLNTPGHSRPTEPFDLQLTRRPGTKVLDTGMMLAAGPQLCFAPAISRFLSALFEEAALAFQTLHFEMGSGQGIHQDTSYVVVDDEPLKLIASWIALEDVQVGTGELMYYVGGHRLPEHVYSGTSKHFNFERDGQEQHDAHYRGLHAEAARRGLMKSTFLPKKGDVLLWHAELPHGGSEVTNAGRTRRSLVTHYCPLSLTPHYFLFSSESRRTKTTVLGGNAMCSMYYEPSSFLSVSAPSEGESGRVRPTVEFQRVGRIFLDPHCVREGVTEQFLDQAETYHERQVHTPYWTYLVDRGLRLGDIDRSGPLRVLDIGSGSGNAVFAELSLLPGADIVASDISPQLLEILARQLESSPYKDRDVKLYCFDLHKDVFRDRAFDVIIGGSVLHRMVNPEAALRNLVTWLDPQGAIVLYEPFEYGAHVFSILFQLGIDEMGEASNDNDRRLAGFFKDMKRDFERRLGIPDVKPWTSSLDDKWFFHVSYLRELKTNLGLSRVETFALADDVSTYFRGYVTSLLKASGNGGLVLPERVDRLIKSFDEGIDAELKAKMPLEGIVIFRP